MKGRLGRSGEPTGRNASERRASLESTNAEADLWDTGKAAIAGDVSDDPRESAGAVAAACRCRRPDATREVPRGGGV